MKQKDIILINIFLFIVIGFVACTIKSTQGQEDNAAWIEFERFSKLSSKQRATVAIVTRSVLKKIEKKINKLESQGIKFKNANLKFASGGVEGEGDLFIVAIIEFNESEEETITLYKGWILCPEPDSPEIQEIIEYYVERIIASIIFSGQIYL